MEAKLNANSSWVIKKILKQGDHIQSLQPLWNSMIYIKIFRMKQLYEMMMDDTNRVPWRYLFKGNCVRPKKTLTTWLACHGRLGK